MLHQNSSRLNPDLNKNDTQMAISPQPGDIDIQQELNRLEEMLLASPRIPLTRKTLVDEEQLLEQLDLIRLHLPSVLQAAQAIVQRKSEIFSQVEQHAQEIIAAAHAKAAQILNETDIVREAQLTATQITQKVQFDCDAMQRQTQAEIEQMRLQAQAELEQMRNNAIAEAEAIQQGADDYADSVLQNIEQQLNEMLRITRNGRQQLHP